ncbi:MAG: tetratricopeptide repeat protein [Sphingomicrobium sp.]
MRGSLQIRLVAALAAGVWSLVGTPAAAQGSYSPYDESPTAAIARYIRTLASDPKDFDSLIGAGKAALALGDAQAAAGFFARADEVNPRSPLPQAGMGAVSIANGEPQAALPYFKRAQQLGASVVSFACDRGLAYDLMGQQTQAQADYRTALGGADADEARRRLALSLAISGDRAAALQMLAPLAAKGDAGVARVRAFVLALSGDSSAAMMAVNAAMPGSASNVAPFLQRLPGLAAGQKAAAVNLGIFPETSDTAYAYAAPPRQLPATPSVASTDRLAGIDTLLRSPSPAAAQPAQQSVAKSWQPPQAVQVAYARPPAPPSVQRTVGAFQPKIWLQLASGQNVDELARRFEHLKSDNPDLFDGIRPYVSQGVERARLLVGPFRGPSDAEIFAGDLKTIGIDAYRFTNSQTDRIAPLVAE